MLQTADSRLPKIFSIHGYEIYFWSQENNEPIHVHVAKKIPSKNGTKLWLTADGGCIVANNNGKIPVHDLNEIMQIVSAQFFLICAKWKEHFKTDSISFYA